MRFQSEHEDDLVAAMPLCDLCGLLLKIPALGESALYVRRPRKTAESQR
jgi:hypothetical protein